MTQTNVQKSLDRLIQIPVTTKNILETHFLLFKEHYRLLIRFAKLSKTRPGITFSNLIKDELPDLKSEFALIKQHLKEKGAMYDFFRVRSFQNVLMFAAWQDTYSENTKNVINPYEPLIMFYERGGFVTPERDAWMIGITWVMFDVSKIAEREEPYISLSHTDIDNLEQLP